MANRPSKTSSKAGAAAAGAPPKSGSVPHTRTVRELRSIVGGWRAKGLTVGLVPTMGALHEGHLSLVRLVKQRCDKAVVSIFVNPRQFAPNEDFDKYPRTWDSDLAALASADGDLVWAPERLEMYPEGFATQVVPEGAAKGLETDFRPQFFAGVATVCCKLFTQVGPDIAVFGEKDFQQLCVIRQMVRDLNLPLEIVAGATVREADGLAMSSRNRYLSASERASAITVYEAITGIAQAARAGGDWSAAVAAGRSALTAAGFRQIDYLDVRDAETLEAVAPGSPRPKRVLAAAWLGQTRLIDNIAVPG